MFPPLSEFLLFLSALVILNLIPGADVLYVLSQSLHHRNQGVFAAFGVSTGIAFYVVATTLGLTAILHQSLWAFNAIKILGGIYLLYLAWKALREKEHPLAVKVIKRCNAWDAYRKGVLTNLLNPKVGLFFLTFLPQFVDPTRGNISLQLFFLGSCFIVSGTIINLMYAFTFDYLKSRLFARPLFSRWLNKITALIFVGLAVKVFSAKTT